MKKAYSAPTLTVYGDATELTQGGHFSGTLDSVYPAGTPSSQGLFSS